MAKGNPALTTHRTPRHRHARLLENVEVGKIAARLNRVAKGEEEMTSTQLGAAKLLLNKVIPDARPLDVSDPLNGARDISHANPHHLLTIIEGQAERKK
jgi:hypothetical protein